jgi:TolB-like protein/AraC-like DNA-binding protein
MTDFLHPTNEFLQKVIAIIEENLADEHFEVPDLAQQLNMSRSNLLRKVKSLSGLSVSVFIRHVRLHHAKKMLMDESLTISEVSYKVGFSSTSYFTKCFREAFGYTPGEEKKNRLADIDPKIDDHSGIDKKRILVWLLILVGVGIVISVFFNSWNDEATLDSIEKSIAVLPFKNDSDDSSNTHIVNGLMEAILDNLQKIEDLEVTSRTSVEKYRGGTKTIPELFKELEVNYFVEGSGQKIGDQILLTIQLIDARNDKHLWSQQYKREAKDIFKLQMEVSKDIAGKIQAIITPDEKRRIEKVPTDNLVAYDHFLKGSDLLVKADGDADLLKAIAYFQQAIAEDPQFAQPYAYIAICYYYLEIFQANRKYGLEINTYADKALLYDAELPESLFAKALFYQQDGQYKLAVDYFEKALTYSPNAGRIHNFLSDIYANYLPNTEKYLKHALQGIRAAISDQDSITASFTYLHLSNALAQTGFINEAEEYVIKSLNYNTQNSFAEYLHIYIKQAKNFDLQRAKEELIILLAKDTSRLDIIQEVAKVCYTLEDYEEAWYYYKKFLTLKEMWGLNIYNSIDINIAFVLDQLGRNDEAEQFYEKFLTYATKDQTIYKDLYLSSYYAAKGEVEKGTKYFKAFTKQRDYQYWIILFLDKDPVVLKLSTHPDFKKTLKEISDNFWIQHEQTREMLEDEGVI